MTMMSGITQTDRDNSGENPAPPDVHQAEVDTKDTPESVHELLRRLNLNPDKQDLADQDPRAAHPNLHLSGSIISATFCLPYDIGFAPDLEWASLPPAGSRFDTNIPQELKQRRGTSALFESFSYLVSPSSPWNHVLLGWTGEIRPLPSAFPGMTINSGPVGNITSISKASAPIPVDGQSKPRYESKGFSVKRSDRERLQKQLEQDHQGKIIPIWLVDDADKDADTYIMKDQSRWRRFAERELYPLFHYKQNKPSEPKAARKAWADYCRMNKMFADHILEIYKPGDIVLIHDYHLMLLPSLLRQRLPNVFIGFFLHIPFPSSEYYRCLGRRKEILEGVLGANMIGFQSYGYSRHFLSCCTRLLGFDSCPAGVDAFGTRVAVDVLPIGINVASTEEAAFSDPAVEEKIKGIQELYAGKKIIVGRDRLDSVRGVKQKLQAFETLLERYPQWQNKVVLIQITSPTSPNTDPDSEDKFISNISDLMARINGLYGSIGFSPVQHFPQYLPRDEYFALLRVADVGLITSVRDGMNTTALEYVVCQKENCGPVIISEFSGTAGSLADAIHVNPWDHAGVAEAIHRALTMSTHDRQTQEMKLYKHVVTHNVQTWIDGYINRLLSNLESFDQSFVTPALDREKLLMQYHQARKRLFLFDYDGTLTPIVRDHQSAIPSDRIIRNIRTLASDPANKVWIISGRDQAFLEQWMGHISELGLSAEHGSFMRHPHSEEWENVAAEMDMSWQQEVMEIFQYFTEQTQGMIALKSTYLILSYGLLTQCDTKPGSFIERKKIALTWHYRCADPEFGTFQASECHKQLNNTVVKKYDIEVMNGKANLEVRPKFVNKGEIVKQLIADYGEGPEDIPEFVLCLGDDFTDEGTPYSPAFT
jgi:trehalose 6-phosphate synthase/phosphatase